MKVRVLGPAFDDLAAGRHFYDRHDEGAGDHFLDGLFAAIDSLVLYAGIHPIRFGFHRLLVKRFPYAVYHRVIGDEAVVFRVLDWRRDPQWIRRALAKEG